MLSEFKDIKIRTNRLYIRKVELSDANDYFSFCKDKEVTKYLSFYPYVKLNQVKAVLISMQRDFQLDNSINLSLIYNSKVIGSISLSKDYNLDALEIGYLLNKDYQNKGFMNEAIEALLNYANSFLSFKFIYARAFDINIPSNKLLLKNNFKKMKEDFIYFEKEKKTLKMNYYEYKPK